MHRCTALIVMMCIGVATSAAAQERPRKSATKKKTRSSDTAGYPPRIADANVEVYKTVGDVRLSMYIFNPKNHQPSDRRAAIVFFFGGGWQSGSPTQFQNQCRRLAERGMVALAADYRVQSRHGANVVDCVADAKSAVRWVRTNADRLGIDPQRIAAAGGSAGGHLAACTALVPGFEDMNSAISSVPNALVLFNPALALARMGDDEPFEPRQAESIRKRVGGDPKAVSPFHHIRPKAPPAIIFHGKDDPVVPFRSVERFAKEMVKAGNRCELVGYDGQSHGFFNFGRGDNTYYQKTLAATEQFLEQLGFLVK